MKDYKASVKVALWLVYAAIVLVALVTVFFPFPVEWFVEIRGKDVNLATTIMIVYYPCIPFAFAFLIALRNLLSNLLSGLIFGDANNKHLKVVCVCCAFAALIMLLGGFRYMPFWISGLAAAAGALLTLVIQKVFNSALQYQREVEYKSVREMYEKDDNIGNR